MRKQLFIFFLIICSSASFSQESGSIKFFGTVFNPEAQKKLSGVSVGLYKGPVKVDDAVTGSRGDFSISVEPNTGDYKLKFALAGFHPFYIQVSTKITPDNLPYEGGFEFKDTPMFPIGTEGINTYALKENPFDKVFFSESQKKMADDFSYSAWFMKKLKDTGEMQARQQKEKDELQKQDNEKAEKERLAKEKAKQEDLEKQKTLQAKVKKQLEIQKAMEDQARLEKENAEQERLAKEKAESEAAEKNKIAAAVKVGTQQSVSMENEEIKLKREKEAKDLALKKNQAIKSEYNNSLLKTVAEVERNDREQEYYKSKGEEEANAVVKRVNNENDLKARLDVLEKELEAIQHSKKIYDNLNIKNEQEKSLIETAAITERGSNEKKYPQKPETKAYKLETQPEISEKSVDGLISSANIVSIKIRGSVVVYKKEIFAWGATYYYRNNEEITAKTFEKELARFNIVLK